MAEDLLQGNPAMRGVGSSIILSFILLVLLSVTWYWPNIIQQNREGEGQFNFDESLCYDLDDVKDVDNTWTKVSATSSGVGALKYSFKATGEAGFYHRYSAMQEFNLPLNDTIKPYVVGSTQPTPAKIPEFALTQPDSIGISINLTKTDLLKLDITRIDIYLDVQGSTQPTLNARLTDQDDTDIITLGTQNLGNLSKFKITVADLLTINNFDDNENLVFVFTTADIGHIAPNSFVVFDLQFYCIDEITTITINKLAYVNYALGIIIIFGGFLMFGSIRLNDVRDWLTTDIDNNGGK